MGKFRFVIAYISLAALIIVLFLAAETAGFRIATKNIGLDYASGGFWAFVILFAIMAYPFKMQHRFVYVVLWILRCVVTLGFMLYYEYIYPLDAQYYFQTAINQTPTFEMAMAQGTYMIPFVAGVLAKNLPLMESYHALKVIWSLLGFTGLYLYVAGYELYTGQKSRRILWVLGLFPSMLFWSSIFGKDPISFIGIACIYYATCCFLTRHNSRGFVYIAFGVFFINMVRTWVVPIFLIPLIPVILTTYKSRVWVKAIIVLGLAIGGAQLFNLSGIRVPASSDEALHEFNAVSRSWSRGGSSQEVPVFNSPAAVVSFLPRGMFTALFRPLPGEVMNFFGIISGFENMVLLLFAIVAIFSIQLHHIRDPFFRYLLLTVLFWSAIYGFVCYQNLGTSVRFRLQILPMLVVLLYFVIAHRENIEPKAES